MLLRLIVLMAKLVHLIMEVVTSSKLGKAKSSSEQDNESDLAQGQ
jgi:hypothetical protein